MFYYLYQITNLVNNNIYVGVHKTKSLDDGYMGSGKLIHRAIEKYELNNFKKDILEFFENAELMYAREKEIVDDEFLLREDTYNLRRGGHGGFDSINKNRTKEDWSNFGKSGRAKSPGTTNITRSPEWRNKLSIANKGQCNFLGKTHSEESIQRMRKAASERIGSKNSQFGTMWITNELENKKIKKTDAIPDGWRQGRKVNI